MADFLLKGKIMKNIIMKVYALLGGKLIMLNINIIKNKEKKYEI